MLAHTLKAGLVRWERLILIVDIAMLDSAGCRAAGSHLSAASGLPAMDGGPVAGRHAAGNAAGRRRAARAGQSRRAPEFGALLRVLWLAGRRQAGALVRQWPGPAPARCGGSPGRIGGRGCRHAPPRSSRTPPDSAPDWKR